MRDINKITNYEDAGDSFPASFFLIVSHFLLQTVNNTTLT